LGESKTCIWVTGEENNYQCAKVETKCESIKRDKTCPSSGVAGNRKCVWVEEEESDYQCAEVETTCEGITRQKRCGATGTVESETLSCFWIYNTNDENINTGTCRNMNDESLLCSNIIRNSQCSNGLSGTFLNEKCTFYGGNCIWRCGVLSKGDCENRANNDCSFIFSVTEGDDGKCYAKNGTLE
jgi:hypothetical protein